MENKKTEYNVYIDESGDEGINKGSKYFILTAIIVKKENDLEISKSVDLIKQNLEMPVKAQLHWKLLKGMPNKKMIMDIVRELDIKIINVIIDTKCIQFIPSNNIYNFFSGYLYERICWYMNDNNGIANINISSRGNLSKENLSKYLNGKNHKKFNIDTSCIKQIKIIPNERKKLLQLADCCCSALFQALKYNNDIHFDYIKRIQHKLYSKGNNILSYGLKLVPNGSNSIELKNLINFLFKQKK